MAKLTQDEKDAIRDAGVAQWWKNWYAADYSWEGLTKFEWQGWVVVEDKDFYDAWVNTHGLPEGCPNLACRVLPDDHDPLPDAIETRPATLQDYWRDQEALLQRRSGQKTYTQAHLPVQYEGGGTTWKADPDHANWRALSTLVERRLACAVKTDVIIFHRGEIVAGQDGRANFTGCVLPAVPSRAHAPTIETNSETSLKTDETTAGSLHLSFAQAAIMQSQNFGSTTFGSPTNFRKSLFSGGDAYFSGAQFSGGDADFSEAQFSGGDADFRGAQFSGAYANFSKTLFSGGKASFREAQFSGGNVHFYDARFSGGNASFYKTQFSGGIAAFYETQFSGGSASFYHAQFSGGDAPFDRARFDHYFDFSGSQFDKSASFENTIFPPPNNSHHAFRGTQFLGPVNFNRTEFKTKDDEPFPSSDLHFPFNAFGLANVKDQLILTQRGDREAQIEFKRALASTAEACRGEDNDFTEDQYVALESGCTVLKRAMENVSDKNRAQRYFEFELRARQRRPSTPPLVKLFTKFYGWTADYGGSISRPLLTLGLLWLGFAFIYGVNALVAGVDLPTAQKFWGPADFSATQVFRPLFIWSKAGMGDTESWLYQYHAGLSAGGWLAIKALATAQSFLSLTLLFLFGLATKRKFQIS